MAVNKRKGWGFYETPEWIADKIAMNLDLSRRPLVIDLGAGTGSLVKALKACKPGVKSLGVEVDRSHDILLGKVVDQILTIDLVAHSIPEESLPAGSNRVIVSNPPFGKVRMDGSIRARLERFELINPSTASQNARLEAVFLSEALKHVKKGSSIAFIISASLLYHDFWKTLRKTLVNKHLLFKVMLLPPKAFKGTEVESAVVFLKPYAGAGDEIVVEDYCTNIVPFPIPLKVFEEGFHGYTYPSQQHGVLGQIVKEMYRGRSCSKVLSDNHIDHLHSSDINSLHSDQIRLKNKKILPAYLSEKVAMPGDILIARVGTRCVGASVLVESGHAVISDSVISVRVPPKKRLSVFRKISSEAGRNWLCQAARGACAKIITYETIQKFPLGAL